MFAEHITPDARFGCPIYGTSDTILPRRNIAIKTLAVIVWMPRKTLSTGRDQQWKIKKGNTGQAVLPRSIVSGISLP